MLSQKARLFCITYNQSINHPSRMGKAGRGKTLQCQVLQTIKLSLKTYSMLPCFQWTWICFFLYHNKLCILYNNVFWSHSNVTDAGEKKDYAKLNLTSWSPSEFTSVYETHTAQSAVFSLQIIKCILNGGKCIMFYFCIINFPVCPPPLHHSHIPLSLLAQNLFPLYCIWLTLAFLVQPIGTQQRVLSV